MPHYLKLRFDPDVDFRNLRPGERRAGSVDRRSMGCVRNVRKGEVLAEWADGPGDPGGAPHREFAERILPAGPGAAPDPSNPNRLLAAADGYPCLLDGAIAVKSLLDVRGSVGAETGNVCFAADVAVHETVRSGFRLTGHNVLVKGVVEASRVRADQSLSCEGGVEGAGRAVLRAGGDMRLAFADKATLLAGGSLLLEGACTHCEVFVGGRMEVKGMLVGGAAYVTDMVFVEQQLGGGLGAETLLALGCDAMALRKALLVETRIKEELRRFAEINTLAQATPALGPELLARAGASADRLAKLKARHREIRNAIRVRTDLENCAVVVPGQVRPGVEVCIGEACFAVEDFLENVRFTFKDGEVVCTSPAM